VRAALLLLGLALAPVVVGANEDERKAAEARLEQVRAQIRELTVERRRIEEERDAAARELREADSRVQQAVAAVRAQEQALAEQRAELARLEAERTRQEAGLGEQREELAGLLRSSHALGRHEQLKLLLAQDRIENAERALGYARVLQRQRLSRIERLRAELAELLRLHAAVEAQQSEVEAALAAQQAGLAELESERGERRALLARIERERGQAVQQLTALGRDEQSVLALLARLKDVFADIPQQLGAGQRLGGQRGRLRWPLTGRVRSAFGGRLPDGRSSGGWLIEAAAGAEVRAVSHGRVAYADWLKGYGLIAILDHGDGFHSLYAHADALLCEVGDWVDAGHVIARAGSSGGLDEAALYFELRQNGRPVDPRVWLQRR
jgi:murein hydrolase activator